MHPLSSAHVGAPVTNRVQLRYFNGYYWLKMRSQQLTFVFRPTETMDFKLAHTTVYAK